MSLQCDFCSAPNPIARYHTHAFGMTTPEQVFGDTPVHIQDDIPYVATEDLHPDYGIGAMASPDWLACNACANYVDTKDLDGLIAHCSQHFRTLSVLPPDMSDAELAAFCRAWYTAFFQQLISDRLPLP